jgi:hypothetical protein
MTVHSLQTTSVKKIGYQANPKKACVVPSAPVMRNRCERISTVSPTGGKLPGQYMLPSGLAILIRPRNVPPINPLLRFGGSRMDSVLSSPKRVMTKLRVAS